MAFLFWPPGQFGFSMPLEIAASTGVRAQRAIAQRAGLDVWMERVLERADKVPPEWDEDDIHALRTALRRCRTMADALQQVNPASGWRKLKQGSRDLFQVMGSLRDTQVERLWVKKLARPGDALRKQMLRFLSHDEVRKRKVAEKALDDFDRKNWRKWSRKLATKASFFPLESVVFQRLALAELNEAVELLQLARKKPSSAAWHRLRIALKRFRYIVENFMPQRYEVWVEDLKRLQDLLGDVHDLDVLRTTIRRHRAKLNPQLVVQWRDRIASERKARLAEFLARTTGRESPWLTWRAAFHWGNTIKALPIPERQTA
jgi:CHAD domain-containing protein